MEIRHLQITKTSSESPNYHQSLGKVTVQFINECEWIHLNDEEIDELIETLKKLKAEDETKSI